jgi:hypothetical protein
VHCNFNFCSLSAGRFVMQIYLFVHVKAFQASFPFHENSHGMIIFAIYF